MLVGPLLAGVLIAVSGPGLMYAVDAVTYVAADRRPGVRPGPGAGTDRRRGRLDLRQHRRGRAVRRPQAADHQPHGAGPLGHRALGLPRPAAGDRDGRADDRGRRVRASCPAPRRRARCWRPTRSSGWSRTPPAGPGAAGGDLPVRHRRDPAGAVADGLAGDRGGAAPRVLRRHGHDHPARGRADRHPGRDPRPGHGVLPDVLAGWPGHRRHRDGCLRRRRRPGRRAHGRRVRADAGGPGLRLPAQPRPRLPGRGRRGRGSSRSSRSRRRMRAVAGETRSTS